MSTQKNLSIETLRGIAILLVVVGHVIGSGPSGGMKIDFPHPLRYLYLWIDYIQMPLFTAIAGWVYALKPFSSAPGFGSFARKKALRLLVPMVVVGTLYFVVQYLTPGTNRKGDLSGMWRILVFPYTMYWYLPSLFLIFMAQWWVDRWKGMNGVKRWGICLLVAFLLYLAEKYVITVSVPNIFSFKGALNQLPYFIIGVGINRFNFMLYGKMQRTLYGALIIAGVVFLQVEWLYSLNGVWWYEILQPIWVFATLMFLLNWHWHNRFLSWVGGYAYSIYLFHGFGTSGGRILLKMAGIKAVTPIFLFATLISVGCPIILDRLVSRYKIVRTLFLGKK